MTKIFGYKKYSWFRVQKLWLIYKKYDKSTKKWLYVTKKRGKTTMILRYEICDLSTKNITKILKI